MGVQPARGVFNERGVFSVRTTPLIFSAPAKDFRKAQDLVQGRPHLMRKGGHDRFTIAIRTLEGGDML